MKRRVLLLTVALGLLSTSLAYSRVPVAKDSCAECAAKCNMIPMDPEDCRQLYCPECPSFTSIDIGVAHPIG